MRASDRKITVGANSFRSLHFYGQWNRPLPKRNSFVNEIKISCFCPNGDNRQENSTKCGLNAHFSGTNSELGKMCGACRNIEGYISLKIVAELKKGFNFDGEHFEPTRECRLLYN